MRLSFVLLLALEALPLLTFSSPLARGRSKPRHLSTASRLLERQLGVTIGALDSNGNDSIPLVIEPASSSNSGATNVATSSYRPLMMGYYVDWSGDAFPPEKVDFTRFDWVDFAFAMPAQDGSLYWDDPTGTPALLDRLVAAAHYKGKKVKLSIGGWDGSQYFSSCVANDSARNNFVNNIQFLYKQHNVDGIEIDWEYPGRQGAGSNIFSSQDSANFLLFLQLLRTKLPTGAMITAAVTDQPFTGPDGNPMTDVSAFGQALDWVLLMNYDVNGASSSPGPNAPLNNGCNNSQQSSENAVGGYKAWTAANFPAGKLVLGVPSYGYLSQSSSNTLSERRRSTRVIRSSKRQAAFKITNADGGQVQFRDLVSQGALVATGNRDSSGSAIFTAPNSTGFTRNWDNCSSTPWLQGLSAQQIVTYDDPISLGAKASFVRNTQMLGVNMFDLHGDTDAWDLTDALRNNMILH